MVVTAPAPSFPVEATSIGISLTYNAQDTTNNGFGPGWTLAAGDASSAPPTKLTDWDAEGVGEHTAQVTWPNGGSDFFNHISGTHTYRPANGIGDQLTKNPDGTWTLLTPDGYVYSFGKDSGNFIAHLTKAQTTATAAGAGGSLYSYDSSGRVTQITDTASTEQVNLNWSCSGYIVCVTGPDGVKWTYKADSKGNLATVNDGTRNLVTYTYGTSGNSNGLIQEIQNADDLTPMATSLGANYNTTHAVTVSYDADKRATQVSEGPISGQTPSTSSWSFSYHLTGPYPTDPTKAAHPDYGIAAGTVRQAAGYTTLTDPLGGQTETYFDSGDHPIEIVDPLGHTSQQGWNGYDEQLWSEDALGNPTDNTWDDVNHVELTSTGPTVAAGTPTTTYRYDETSVGSATSAGPSLEGLQAQYFNNVALSGHPVTDRTDPSVDFDWGSTGPDASVGGSSYSARFTGDLIVPADGNYVFSIYSDGGVAFTVDNLNVITDDTDTSGNQVDTNALGTHTSAEIPLTAGEHQIELDYEEGGSASHLHLLWSCATCASPFSTEIVPSSALRPAYDNQTTIVSPAGRVTFSHFVNPSLALPDYKQVLLGGGESLITAYKYDNQGRLIEQINPRGVPDASIDQGGQLGGALDTTYSTTWTYYPTSTLAAPPSVCGSGAAVNQGGQLETKAPHGMSSTSYVYDSAGRQLSSTDGAGTTCTSYTAEGRIASTTDPDGNTTTYAYDPAGNKTTVTNPDKSTDTTVYDESGAVISTTDENGHTTATVHDALARTIKTTDPRHEITTNTYDAAGNLTSTTDPLGRTTTYGYDADNRQTTVTTPLGHTTTTTYDALGRTISVTDPLNHTTSYGYDLDGNKTSVTDALGKTTSSTYDGASRLTSTTDPLNHTTSYGYDADGNKTSVTAADGGVTRSTYDENNNVTSTTDPDNHTTTYTYDAENRLLSTTLPTGETTKSSYDANGNKTSTTDAVGNTTTYSYDSRNRLIKTTTPCSTPSPSCGEVTKEVYDPAGNKIAEIDPLGRKTQYTYNADNQRTAAIDPAGDKTTTIYDGDGETLSTTDGAGITTSYAYDGEGNEVSATVPDGSGGSAVTLLSYDDAGNLAQRTDPNHHSMAYTYDADNQLLTNTDPLARVTTYTYDAAGNKSSTATGLGTITYTYDPVNRPASITYSDGTSTVTYGYDLAGNQTSMSDGAGTETYSYDASNRLIGTSRGGSGFAYSYDGDGRLASRTYPDSEVTSYTYDADSQLKTVTNASHQTTYKYDAAGELTETDLPNSWTIQRTYDAAGRALEIKSVNGSQTLADTKYTTRDGDGNPVQISRDGNVENYTYDTAGRVSAVCYGAAVSGCPSANLITYSYDAVGNRVSQANAGTTTTYTYDADDELTQSTTGGTNSTYTYDANGNETSSGTTTFDFNLANQLTEADTPTTTVTYAYDGNGNRITKSAAGTTTAYTWDENNDLPQLATESQNGSVVRSYVYGLGLFAMNSGGASYYLHTDELGSTLAVTDGVGNVETKYSYDPYGNVRNQTNVDPNAPTVALQFAGQLIDSETGLYDMRARLYDPATGRFLSQDPDPPAPTTAAIVDYSYGADDPLAYTDPSGAMLANPGGGGQTDCSVYVQNGEEIQDCGGQTYDLGPASQSSSSSTASGRGPSSAKARKAAFDRARKTAEPERSLSSAKRVAESYHYNFNLGPGSPQGFLEIAHTMCSGVFPLAGCKDDFKVGDKMVLHETAENVKVPWPTFPVKVVAITGTSFTFKALAGHPEGAGRTITFSFAENNEGDVVMSVKTSSNGSALTKDPLDIPDFAAAKHTWTSLAANLKATYDVNSGIDDPPPGTRSA